MYQLIKEVEPPIYKRGSDSIKQISNSRLLSSLKRSVTTSFDANPKITSYLFDEIASF